MWRNEGRKRCKRQVGKKKPDGKGRDRSLTSLNIFFSQFKFEKINILNQKLNEINLDAYSVGSITIQKQCKIA